MTQSDDSRISKIRKLLAMAEDRAASEQERDAFNAKATELMLQWGIEEALLAPEDRPADKIITKLFHIDVPKSFSFEYAKIGIQVANALGAKGLFQRLPNNRTVTMVVGYESDIARIELLIQSLITQATIALQDWWRRNESDYYGGTERFNAKRSFITGFADGVRVKLTAVYKQTVASAGHGAELVLVDRTKQVAQWMSAHVRTGKSRTRNYQADAHGHGHSAGQRADVGQTRVGQSSSKGIAR